MKKRVNKRGKDSRTGQFVTGGKKKKREQTTTQKKENKRTRDARTGRFVDDGVETTRPHTTMREVIDSPASRRGKIARTVVRDTINGQFLPRRAASKRPGTTIVQTIYYTVPTAEHCH